MTTLAQWILQACNALELQADFNFVVDAGDGHAVETIARIRNLGAKNGMLVVRNYDDVRPYAQDLTRAGYGYVVLDEPRSDEMFDLDSFKEMFRDWGWCGEVVNCPPCLQ